MADTLCLIDSHAQVYRAYYAHPDLTSPDGRPTGAVFGYVAMLDSLLAKLKPERLAAVFDPPGKTFRHERYPEYKAQRKPTPPELHEQVPLIQEILRARNIPVLLREGFEADDVIGSLVRRAREAGLEAVIATGDKDFGQLLAPGVRMFTFDRKSGDGWKFVDAAAFEEAWGARPEQVPDLFGLAGDASDNIPGIPGVGEKTAADWLRRYGTLDKLLEYAHEIKGKRGEDLRKHKADALLSRELATIRTDVPLDFNLDDTIVRPPDIDRLRQIYIQCGFRRFLHQLGEEIDEW